MLRHRRCLNNRCAASLFLSSVCSIVRCEQEGDVAIAIGPGGRQPRTVAHGLRCDRPRRLLD